MHSYFLRYLPLLAFLSFTSLSCAANAATLNVPSQYTTIQSAVNAAQNGDTVLIADGTYTGPGNVDIDFGGRNIAVTSQNGATSTIIDCQGSRSAYHRGFYLHSNEKNTVISGLTIQNGYEGPNAGDGGGIWNFQAGLSVQNCIIRNNFDAGGGGGIASFVEYSNSTTVTNCVIVNNVASAGGGMDNYADGGGRITVTNCTITGNSTGNGVSSGLYDLGSAINLINDIVYANPGTNIAAYNGSPSDIASHCDIQGGLPTGVTDNGGNISADPLFVNSSDLHLQLSSPCLGAGAAAYAPMTTVDGRTRPNPPSIGAYEQAQAMTTLTSSLNPSVAGRSITFTASVNSDGGAATGTIVFTVDGTAQPPVPLGHFGTATGMASYTTSSLSVGTHTVTAAYSGDSKFPPSASSVLTEVVNDHISPQYVSPSGSDSNPGTQAAPKRTIQAALNASLSGDAVFVGDGTYTGPGNVDLTLGGQNIAVLSLDGPFSTIINCAGTSSANHRGFLLNTETQALIVGFTIENGYEGGGSTFSTGGAILNYSSGLTLDYCILKNNTATTGGGLYNSASGGGPVSLSNCIISGNTTLNYVSGSVSSGGNGGGIENASASGSGFTIVNCTVTGNAAASGGNGGGLDNSSTGMITLTNDIFYGDTGGEIISESTASPRAASTYCDVQGGYAGTGNISANPLFVSASDLHLQYGSPCVGAGTASGAPTTTIDGMMRPNPPSIGAYEAAQTSTATALASSLNPSAAGQGVTFTATVTGTSGTPTGTVVFTVDGAAQPAAALSSGAAAFSTAALAAGPHRVMAAYSGDQFNAVSTSAALTQTVNPPVSSTIINDTNGGLAYAGASWGYYPSRGLGDFQDDVHAATSNGDAASYTFTGTSISYLTETNTDEGNVQVYLDGTLQATVNAYSATRQVQQTLWSKSGLSAGSHTLKLVKAGGSYLLLDALEFTPAAPAAGPVNDTSSSVAYTGASWGYYAGRGVGDYQDDVHAASANGDFLTFSFTGTSVSYITETNSDEGTADVYLDGVLQTTVNGYSSARQTQQTLWSKTGLAAGPHTLKLVKTGGSYLLLDAFAATPASGVSATTVNDNSSSVAYAGAGWTYYSGRGLGDVNDDVHATTVNGNTASCAFTGTNISYITETNSDEGTVDVYIDGVFQQTVNCQSTSRRVDQSVYSVSGLASGSHIIKLVKTGGSYMLLDAFSFQ